MKLLVEVSKKDNLYLDEADGIILALENFSVESVCYFTIDEIINIKNKTKKEVFVKLNKNFFNDDIESLKDVLKILNDNNIDGVFFYDLAVLQLKKELNLRIELVWNQTHMINNYKTCDYYFSKGVKYALLGKEITLDEIKEIIKNSSIISMVEVVSKPSVAFSKRHLVSNYYKDLDKASKNEIVIHEKVSDCNYIVVEDKNGTCFYLDAITNGTSVIKDLYDVGCKYIIFREYGIGCFNDLISDTKKYIDSGCSSLEYVQKYRMLGDSTNFFFKKTVYKVK